MNIKPLMGAIVALLEIQNKRTAIMSFVMSASLLLMLTPGIAGAAVVLWNKLGSEAEILNSEIGPGIQQTSYKFADWGEAKIVPAQFGNGLFVNHDTGEGWRNDGGNFFATDLAQTALTPVRGTIEFWFKFQYNSSTRNHAHFFLTADAFTNHFPSGYPHADIVFSANWNGWDYGSFGKRFCFSITGANLCTPDYSAGPGGALDFDIGTIMHFAFVWDADGIDGTEDTMRIYVDGQEWADTQSGLSTTGDIDQFLYIGTLPNYGGWDHYYNAVKGVTDNLIIRDVAKTDFSDRFTESPFPPNEPPVAEAGSNQSIHVGQIVQLDGSGSNDVETLTEDLIYDWSFDSVPAGSAAVFDLINPIAPTFVVDLPGDYLVSLVVTDEGDLASDPSQLTVSSLNTPPTAKAGTDQSTYVGSTVVLDGSASSDPDFDPIVSYDWSLAAQPAGSSVVLGDPGTAFPSFVPDLVGTYIAQLIVSDGYADSAPDLVTAVITTTEDYATVQTVENFNTIASLPESNVTTSGNKTALGNALLQVIESLGDDPPDLEKARKKLEDAIERTDGCALRGTPDVKGGGASPKADTINNCADQEVIYPLLVDALNAILP
jgi:hypothetical protein